MLEIQKITKLYSTGKGIKDISFKAYPGDVVAVLGPNGSGKSTLIKIIAGINKPTQGQITFYGKDTNKPETKKIIGYLPENIFLYPNLTPIDFINFVAAMKGYSIENDLLEKWIDAFDLKEVINSTISSLSMGMKKKVGLICAFIGNPKLIILDEPTNALDTKAILVLKELIYEQSRRQSTIIISSHLIDFVEKVVNKVVFIKNGVGVYTLEQIQYVNLEAVYKDIFLRD